jgi:signal transduction histidine kinase
MKTALLVTDSAATQQLFGELFAGSVNLIPVPPPQEPSREKFDALFTMWLRLVEVIVVDAVALGQMTRWAVESLSSDTAQRLPVIIRVTAEQLTQHALPDTWLVVTGTDSPAQLRQAVANFLELHEARVRLGQVDERRGLATEPHRPATVAGENYRYRDALKKLSRLLGRRPKQREMLAEFSELVRELLGVGKLAVLTRPQEGGLFGGELGAQLIIACSHGVAAPVVEHLRLTTDAGIGGCLAREVRILRRREAGADARIEREFELLGTDVAVPLLDNDRLIGLLTFSGKITGEALTNEELELVYQLAGQLAQAIRADQLAERMAAQQQVIGEVLAHVDSGVLAVDQDEQILAVNDRLRGLLELGHQPLIGQQLGRIPGRVSDVVFELLSGQHTHLNREVLIPRTNRPLRVRATRFAQSDTGKAVVVALVEDLTQEKLEQAHNREVADREFLMRLAFRLSHELKNSLVSIKIFAQLLPERYNEKDFREQFSSVVANEVNRVDVLVNNLTFFSHPLALVHEEVVLTDVLESCIKNVGTEFARRQLAQIVGVGEKALDTAAGGPVVTLKKNFGHKLARLEGDKLRLLQAFEHVTRNALQAMPTGGRLLLTTADAEPADFPDGNLPAGGAVKIQFQDTGEGISLENLKRVSEPFVTTRNVGVGLGLTIVKKIAERHGGRLEIDSLLGRGTTVTLVLPVKAPPHPEDALIQEIAKQTARNELSDDTAAVSRLSKPLGQEQGERS